MQSGVTFGTFHSFRAWGLMLSKRPVISPPEPKYKLIEVPGSDAVIDLTEALAGTVTYRPREIKCEFVTKESRERWAEIHSAVMNAIHGKRLQIVLDNDPDYYYIGRITVGDMQNEKGIMTLSVTATVEPYKYERYGNGRKL